MRLYSLPEYEIGADLHEKPKETAAYFHFLEELEKTLQQDLTPNERLAALEAYAIGSCLVGQLNSAEISVKVALKICQKESYPEKLFQNKIRLAQIHQWKKNFTAANDLLHECENAISPSLSPILVALFWHHKGLNLFDQMFFELAAEHFQKALDLRRQIHAPEDQIKSSEFALKIAKDQVSSTDRHH